jgi:bacterioferritin-associated ferredoxin
MYVCICNAVTEDQIHALVDSGVSSLEAVQQITGCSATCGSCRDRAEQTFRAARRRKTLSIELPVVLPGTGQPA